MLKITKLEIQKNNKDKYNLYVNDEFYCGVFMETAIKLNLKEGLEIEKNKLDEAVFENEKTIALNRCAKLLSKTLKTEKQIKDYLKTKGFNENVILAVLEKLKEYSYVDDKKYAELFIKSNLNKMGKLKLKQKLKEKGIKKDLIESSLSLFDTDLTNVLNIAEKYIKNKELNQKTKASTYRHLLSKGFSYDEIKQVIEKLFSECDYGSWDWYC